MSWKEDYGVQCLDEAKVSGVGKVVLFDIRRSRLMVERREDSTEPRRRDPQAADCRVERRKRLRFTRSEERIEAAAAKALHGHD